MKLMRYAGNANLHDQTGAITGTDGRPDVQMHGIGEFTDDEVATLSAMGLVLVAVDDGGLEDKTVQELRKAADKEGVELEDGAKKDEIISALRGALANSGEQAALAAAATSGGTASAVVEGGGSSSSVTSPSAGGTGTSTAP